jgi:phage/plasmid-like protein (TIGR03299 family)
MSHEIDMSNNRANMAFTGSRQAIWHGLGQELTDNASIDTWKKEAGMDWVVEQSPVLFEDTLGISTFKDKKVLYRGDTRAPLSVVGSEYRIVQPEEILEFFRDLVDNNSMKLSTAGVLFGGKRFWALAELDKSAEVVNGDVINGYLLLSTSVDGSLATTAKVVSERVVCNNTLTIAMKEDSKNMMKVSHKSVWDASKVKFDMGLIDDSWGSFITNMRKLANTPMTAAEVRKFFVDVTYNKEVAAEDQSWLAVKKVNDLMYLYANGAGSEYSKGTAWGALNAITDLYTHETRTKDESKKFWAAYYDSDKQKLNAVNKLLAA